MYEMKLSEKQLVVIMKALDEYCRVRMGQFFDLSDELAFMGFDYQNHTDAEFDERIERKDAAKSVFEGAYRIACPVWRQKSEMAMVAEDLWRVIRHERWLEQPDDEKYHWTVDAADPLIISGEPPATVRRVAEDDQ